MITSSAMASSEGGTVEAERPGGRQIDDQLELARLHHRQACRLCVLEDATGIDADLTPRIRNVGSVAHQTAGFGIVTVRIGRGYHVARRQYGKVNPPALKKWVGADEEDVGPLAPDAFEGQQPSPRLMVVSVSAAFVGL